MRFQEGDIVKIAKTSRYYNSGGSNVKDTEGTLKFTSESSFRYSVRWDAHRWAYYNDEDLRLVRRP